MPAKNKPLSKSERIDIPVREEKETKTYLPSQEDQKIIDFVSTELNFIETSTTELRKTIQKCRQNYDSIFSKPTTATGRKKVFVPLTREKVNAVVPKVSFDARSLVVNPVEESDIKKAKVAEELLKFQVRKLRFFDKLANEEIRNLAIDGTMIAKVYWDTKKNEPAVYFIDLLDFYISPNVDSIESAPIVIERFVLTEAEVRNNPIYQNTEFVCGEVSTWENTYDSTSTRRFDIQQGFIETQAKMVEVFEAWTDDEVITIAGRKNPVLIRHQVNPFKHGKKPYVEAWFDKMGRRWNGLGVAEKLIDLQRWVNQLINQRIENREILLNKMFLLRRGAVKDIRNLISRPAGFIEVDNINTDIKPLEFSDITAASYQDENNIYMFAERVTGSFEIGQGGGSSRTASEALIKARGIESRFGMVKDVLKDFILRVLEMILQLDMQFLDKSTTIRITGEENDFKDFDQMMGIPDQAAELMGNHRFIHLKDAALIRGQYDLDIDLDQSIIADRAVRIKQLLDLLAIAGNDPTQPLSPEDRKEIYRKVLEMQGLKIKLEGLKRQQVQPMLPPGQPAGMGAPSGGAVPRPEGSNTTSESVLNSMSQRLGVPSTV